MKPQTCALVVSVLLLGGCGDAGDKAAGIVQAAGKAAGESMQELGAKIAELSQTAPEEARRQTQALLDEAARELQEVRDSETARRIAEELDAFIAKLGELRQSLATKVNVAKVQQAVEDLIQRFKDDPRVTSALKSLQERLSSIAR